MRERESRPVAGAIAATWWLWLPVAVGVVLRCWTVHLQVLGGDEVHAVRAALSMPLAKALTTYRPSDHCMPLSGFYRLQMDLGIALSELQMRLPILASAFLFLWFLPWWTARRLGRHAACAAAWLAALSPLLIHYGRLVRSYMPIVLLGLVAVAAFESWLRTASRRRAALYVVTAALAAYFHLVSVPFVLSPFLYFAAAKLWRRDAVAPSWRSAVLLGLTTTAGFLLFLIPAWSSLMRLISHKQQPSQVRRHTWEALLKLQSGTGSQWLVTIFWLLALAGFVALLRKKPALAAYSAVLVAGQVAGLFILSPLAMHQGTIFSRYMLVTLPLVLIWVAVGTAALWRARRPWGPLARAAAAAVLGALAVSGPVLDREFRRSPFVLRPESLLFYMSRPAPDVALPEPYASFEPRRQGPIVEYPWHTTWRFTQAITFYQQIHGRRVITAPGERLLWDDRLIDLRNMVAPRLDRILATDAAYLVVHLASEAENAAFDRRAAPPGSGLARDREQRRRDLEKFDRQVANRLPVFEKRWGPADFTSQTLRVWDLARVREGRRR